jgi:Zn-dependent M28 family amino/carboxypeptidase
VALPGLMLAVVTAMAGSAPVAPDAVMVDTFDVAGELTALVAAMTGEAEIEPGVRLSQRATAEARAATRRLLVRSLERLGVTPYLQDYGSGANVFGTLPATEPGGETIVLGAHFDSVPTTPGANDNATGVALVHGALALLQGLPCRTRALTVVYFDEEERRLLGSRVFARLLEDRETRVHSVHTVDQIGWDRDGDGAFEVELPTSGLLALYRRVALDHGVAVHETETGSTDHASFRRRGFHAVGLTEEYVNDDTTPHYHRPTDTYQTVDFAYLAAMTRLVADALQLLLTEGCR